MEICYKVIFNREQKLYFMDNQIFPYIYFILSIHAYAFLGRAVGGGVILFIYLLNLTFQDFITFFNQRKVNITIQSFVRLIRFLNNCMIILKFTKTNLHQETSVASEH